MINHDYIAEYIRNTIKKNDGILKNLEDYAQTYNVPIIQPEVAALLKVVLSIKAPEKILEVGTAIGYSALVMSESLSENGIIDTIERNEEIALLAEENIKSVGKSKIINIIKGDALEILPCLNKKYDVIFLDGAKGQYPEFLNECLRMLKPKGLLISDNILYKGMVAEDSLLVRRKKTLVTRLRTYLKLLCEDSTLETSIIPIGDGVALSYKK